MTREEAIEKIRKLQTLKEGASKVDSEGEMRNAATIIDKLQKQFGITMEEVYSSQSGNETYDSSQEEPDEERSQQVNENLSVIRQNIDKALWRIVNENSDIADGEKKREVIRDAFDNYEYNLLSNEKIQEKCHRLDINLGYCFDDERENIENQLESSGYFDSKCVSYDVKDNNVKDGEKPKKKLLNIHINWKKYWFWTILFAIIAFPKYYNRYERNRESKMTFQELQEEQSKRAKSELTREAERNIAKAEAERTTMGVERLKREAEQSRKKDAQEHDKNNTSRNAGSSVNSKNNY